MEPVPAKKGTMINRTAKGRNCKREFQQQLCASRGMGDECEQVRTWDLRVFSYQDLVSSICVSNAGNHLTERSLTAPKKIGIWNGATDSKNSMIFPLQASFRTRTRLSILSRTLSVIRYELS